jgi:predicted nucleic acid-binding protein
VAVLYLDTSALVKLYVREQGTDAMLQWAHPDAGHRLTILSLSRVEFRAAVRRREKLGDIDAGVADELVRTFGDHLASMFQIQPVNEAVLENAAMVIDRHTLRAYDAIQLGGCLVLHTMNGGEVELQFVCTDEVLLEAARTEGLTVINPIEL